jgi:hypothetical protein
MRHDGHAGGLLCSFKTVTARRAAVTGNDMDPVGLSERLSSLNAAVRAGAVVPAGRLYGLPELPDGGCWVDMAGAAALTGFPPKTITGWLARGGPLRNPFPVPARILYRLYWPRTAIESWRSREPKMDPSSGVGITTPSYEPTAQGHGTT